MSLYPSLEDMKVDQMCRAQISQMGLQSETAPPPYPTPDTISMPVPSNGAALYPSLGNFMGMELSEAVIAENMPEYSQIALLQQRELVVPAGANSALIAPVSGQSVGLHRAQVTHGVREVILCKDKEGKVGIRVKAINNGIFICVVIDKSPASLVGLRFGDQILQINDKNVAGYNMDKVHDIFKKCPVNGIKVVVRDRPFERTLTLHKDSAGSIGFQFKNGKIVSLVKDSSAARNGVLTDHQLLEVDGQNVVGLKDKQIRSIIDKSVPSNTYLTMSENFYQYQSTPCKEIDAEYYCHEALLIDGWKQDDCIFQLLQLSQGDNTCTQVPIRLVHPIIEQITETYYIGIFPNETKIQTTCRTTDFTILRGTYLFNLPPKCNFKTSDYTYSNEKEAIRGQPLLLPEIRTTKSKINVTRELKLKDVPLDKLHTLKKEQEDLEPIYLKRDVETAHYWTAPLYIIFIIFVLVLAIHRFRKCKSNQTTQQVEATTIAGQSRDNEGQGGKVLFVPNKTSV